MPSIWENIKEWMYRFGLKHQATLLSGLRCAFVVLVLALFLEVFVFNINYFTSSGSNTIDLSEKLDLSKNTDGSYKITSNSNVLEFHDLNTKVSNVRLDFDAKQEAQLLEVKIQFTDGAHATYFDSTEYTVGVPSTHVVTNNTQSEYINLTTSGYVDDLRIEIGGENVQYPVKLDSVYLNAHHPFDFSNVRFMLAIIVLSLIYVFRPHSSIYRCFIVERPRKSKAVIVVTVTLEVMLLSSFLFFGSNLVGVATAHYNWGDWDGKSIANTFEVGGENAQQYAELAKSITKGTLYLAEEPPQWLQEMEDPYNKEARDEAQKETGEGYLFDVAYHDGHYYVYFGVVPVLIFYLPFYLITGANFPTAIGVLLASIAFALGCTALLDRFARYHFKRVSLGLYLLVQIPLVMCCGMLYLLKFPTFYSLPIMLGLAFSVWGLYCWLKGRVSQSSGRWYFMGSLCMALVIGCRPQLVLLSFVAFPLFWRIFITEKHLFTKKGTREFICLLFPYFLVLVGLLWYNAARFGSPLNFGANYNLTVNDMTKRGFEFGRLAPALFAYLFQTPSTTGTFPYLQPVPFDTTYMGQTIKEVTFGGVFACLPIVWILPFAGRILKLRISQRSTRTVAGIIMVLLVTGVIIALLDAQMAGILQRYFADFSFMFLAASVLLVFIVNENFDPRSTTHQILMRVLLVLVTVSVLYSVLLCFVPETGWYSDIYSWAYQGIIETMQFWT